MGTLQLQLQMIDQVATALDDLSDEVVFVGGCVTGLLVDDEFTLEQIRFTEDVDLIVNIITHADWRLLLKKLRSRGFTEDMADTVICRMRLGGLKVDIMPVEEKILGFANRWYADAIKKPFNYKLSPVRKVNILSPVYFVATKLEAYNGRGNKDVLASHDIEDLLTVFDGRSTIVDDMKQAESKVRKYIIDQMRLLLDNVQFEYAIQSVARGDRAREQLIFKRIQNCLSP